MKTTTSSNSSAISVEYYTKNGKHVVIQKRIVYSAEATITTYNTSEKITSYYDTLTDKIVKYNTPSAISVNLNNYFINLANTTMGKILMRLCLTIKSVDCEGTEAYLIKALFEDYINEEYIDKATDLTIKTIFDNDISKKEYEFENVNDEIFIELDISKYSVVEDEIIIQ